jgi:hypothetical protein
MSEAMEARILTAFAWCVLVPLGFIAIVVIGIVEFIGGWIYPNNNYEL